MATGNARVDDGLLLLLLWFTHATKGRCRRIAYNNKKAARRKITGGWLVAGGLMKKKKNNGWLLARRKNTRRDCDAAAA